MRRCAAARALLALRQAEALGPCRGSTPPVSELEREDFDGELAFRRRRRRRATSEVDAVIRAAGDVAGVDDRPRRPSDAGRRRRRRCRQIRIDLRRLDTLMNLIGELVIARERLVELARDHRSRARPSRRRADLAPGGAMQDE